MYPFGVPKSPQAQQAHLPAHSGAPDRDRSEALLTVDLDALASNHAYLKRQAGGAEVAPVVKADAYGLGAANVAARLHAEGARTFFVARVSEGEALRRALGERPVEIYVLDGACPGAAGRLESAVLTPVLNSLEQVRIWSAHARGGPALPAALHVDTGMNRLGLRVDEAETLAGDPDALAGLRLQTLMSHLACAEESDNPTNPRQLSLFRSVRALFPDARASLCNSAGLFLGESYHFDLARPGISLYGGGPRGVPDPNLRAVATFEAPLLQVRDAKAGETVGYGCAYAVTRSMRIGVMAAGYADGMLRSGWKAGTAVLHGRSCPLLGRISMDLIALDVSEVEAAPGDLVQLLGPEALLDQVATAAGTISYELLTRLSHRAERRYLGRAD